MSVVINRVYTKVGDAGTSRLAGGQELPKCDERFEAYGTIDELNAAMGVLAEAASLDDVDPKIRRIQNELFDLGGELAVLPQDRSDAQILISDQDIKRLEDEIDEINESLETLRSFILPGGGVASALCHQARTICRRAERRTVALHNIEAQRSEVLQYLNRLSDWLFVVGRKAARDYGHDEVLWRPGDREEAT